MLYSSTAYTTLGGSGMPGGCCLFQENVQASLPTSSSHIQVFWYKYTLHYEYKQYRYYITNAFHVTVPYCTPTSVTPTQFCKEAINHNVRLCEQKIIIITVLPLYTYCIPLYTYCIFMCVYSIGSMVGSLLLTLHDV
jgi:hypothetical protein